MSPPSVPKLPIEVSPKQNIIALSSSSSSTQMETVCCPSQKWTKASAMFLPEELFDVKPVIMRAFQAAKAAKKHHTPGDHGEDYVVKSEFRLLLVYLGKYFELWELFEEIDTEGSRRIDIDQFRKALPRIEHWGVHVTDVESTFKEIEGHHGNHILFDEFAHWALSKHLDELHPDE